MTTPHSKWREIWDATARVKSQLESDSAASRVLLAWRYDAAGRELAFVGLGSGDLFQHDARYDERGNLTDEHLSYPEHPDLNAPSSADVWMGTTYDNKYDDNGRLLRTIEKPYGEGNHFRGPLEIIFSEDADQHCTRIERRELDKIDAAETTVETRSYDAAGHLASVEAQQWTASKSRHMPCTWIITTYQYDAQGRLERSIRKAAPNHGCDETVPYYEENRSYNAAGDERIESIDYTDDVGVESLMVAGKSVWASRSVRTRTAVCRQIDEQIQLDPSLRCKI